MRTRQSLAGTLMISLLLVGCAGETPEDPAAAAEVDAVVARYVEALGGADSLGRIETLRKSGTYVYNGLEHPLTVLQKRGARCREEIEGLTEYGTTTETGTTIVRAFDGETAWVASEGAERTVEKMPDELQASFVLEADFESPLVGFRDKGHSIRMAGEAQVEGVDVILLDLELASGQTQRWFLNRETYLPVMKTTEMAEGDFAAARTWYLDDYREVEGVQMPFYVLVEEMLFSREYILDEIVANVAIDDALFAEPGS